ncbi:hypothetical protein L218DRAFT_996385 [Marasmius fiardii PR-910]|nr:hypothetical protein L218DRAFT_996385 [Marasmius fiardii PR-910]
MSLPFNLSYLIFTPRHVKLPGQKPPPGASPRKRRTTAAPGRWLGRLVMKTKSIRTRKSSANAVTKPLLEAHGVVADADDFLMGDYNDTSLRDDYDHDKSSRMDTDDSRDPNITTVGAEM